MWFGLREPIFKNWFANSVCFKKKKKKEKEKLMERLEGSCGSTLGRCPSEVAAKERSLFCSLPTQPAQNRSCFPPAPGEGWHPAPLGLRVSLGASVLATNLGIRPRSAFQWAVFAQGGKGPSLPGPSLPFPLAADLGSVGSAGPELTTPKSALTPGLLVGLSLDLCEQAPEWRRGLPPALTAPPALKGNNLRL